MSRLEYEVAVNVISQAIEEFGYEEIGLILEYTKTIFVLQSYEKNIKKLLRQASCSISKVHKKKHVHALFLTIECDKQNQSKIKNVMYQIFIKKYKDADILWSIKDSKTEYVKCNIVVRKKI